MRRDPAEEGRRETLELLVPEGGELLRRAGAAAELARSLGGGAARPAAPDAARSREELERQRRLRVGIALEDLLVHHLSAQVGGGGFAWFGRARGGLQQAWRTLDLFRDSRREPLPGVPAPGESPLAVAGRLLEGLYRLGWDPRRLELWRARLEHAGGGAERGEAAFRDRLDEEEEDDEGSVATRARLGLVAGWVEALLDRGAVRDARVVLEEHAGGAIREDRRLAQLAIWTTLLAGDLERALRLASCVPPWDATIPDALIELRERWPEALPALAGRPAAAVAAPPLLDEPPLRSRRPLGASVFGVFTFGVGRHVEPLLLDVAPGLRRRVGAWLLEREGACCVPSQPEHRLVLEATPCCSRGPNPPGALGERALALAHAPVLDDEGEVAGWLHVECEHHLPPSRARLAELVRAWRLPLIHRARRAESSEAPVELGCADRVFESGPGVVRWGERGARDRLDATLEGPEAGLAAEVFEGVVEALGFATEQRSWWGFVARGGQLRLAGSGGDGLGDARCDPGGGRALDRCLATRGAVAFDEPDRRLSVHGEAASGLVLPFAAGGELLGLLAVESRRRRAFPAEMLERSLETAAAFALPLQLAGFRAWHLERFGHDLFLDTTSAGFRAFAAQLERIARSPSPVVVSGGAGSGKTVLARWIHWLGRLPEAPLVAVGDLGEDGEHLGLALREALGARRGGSVLLDEIGSLPAAGQAELCAHLEGFDRAVAARGREDSGAPRLIVTSTRPLEPHARERATRRDQAPIVPEQTLRRDLAARLDRLQVHVPALADRRGEIPALARFFAARFAREEGCRPPRFSDEALALLWRQPWKGNLRELESLVFKLVVLFPDEDLDPERVSLVARRFRLELESKLPTRRPRRADVVAALRTTLIRGGSRINKRRAAQYLGWDPDTLVARLAELGLDEETLREEPRAWEG